MMLHRALEIFSRYKDKFDLPVLANGKQFSFELDFIRDEYGVLVTPFKPALYLFVVSHDVFALDNPVDFTLIPFIEQFSELPDMPVLVNGQECTAIYCETKPLGSPVNSEPLKRYCSFDFIPAWYGEFLA